MGRPIASTWRHLDANGTQTRRCERHEQRTFGLAPSSEVLEACVY